MPFSFESLLFDEKHSAVSSEKCLIFKSTKKMIE